MTVEDVAGVGAVLLVEDEPTFLDILERVVARLADVRVAKAKDAEEAWRSLEAERADLVICDQRLPRGKGSALLRAVRGKWPRTECVLITAFGEDLDEAERRDLDKAGIRVCDKEVVSERWLRELLGAPRAFEEAGGDEVADEILRAGDVPVTHRLAVAQLERDDALRTAALQRHALLQLAEPLLSELRRIAPKEGDMNISPEGDLTIQRLIREIESQSPFGQRLILLDREIQATIARRRRGLRDWLLGRRG